MTGSGRRSGEKIEAAEGFTVEEEVAGTLDGMSEKNILERTSRVLAIIPSPEGVDADLEVMFRRTKVAPMRPGKLGGGERTAIVICEICVTTIDSSGNRTTICMRIDCPKGESSAPKPDIV